MKNGTPPTRRAGRGRRHGEGLCLATILPRLRNARQLPSGEWLSSCPLPTHGQGRGDRNPSLSLRETPDGNLLVHCFAGCDSREVLQELRRLAGIDAPSRRQVARRGVSLAEYARAKHLPVDWLRQWHLADDVYKDGRPCIRIEYRNEQGEVACIQYRLRLEGDPRFVWREGDSGALYGLWRVPEFSGRVLWLVEGHTDALTLWTVGAAAIALPSASAGQELLRQAWEAAGRFQQVYVCFDYDKAGQELLQRFATACPAEALLQRVQVVAVPAPHKDLNALWCAVGGDADAFKERLRECLTNAEPLESLRNASEPVEEPEEPIRVVAFHELEEPDLPALVPNFLYEGAVSILAGLPASGKTSLALELACAVVEGGTVWGGLQLPQGAVLWYPADHPAPQLRLIANQYYGEQRREQLYFVDLGEFHEPLCPETYHKWRNLLLSIRPRLVVLDTLYHALDVVDELRDVEARQGVRLLRNLAQEAGCAILCLHHPRKANPDQPATYALSGNLRWAAAVDVLAFLHLIRREGYAEGQLARLTIAKNRFGECPKNLDFLRANRRFLPVDASEVPRSEWQVVQAHLQCVGEAGFEELLEVLRARGFILSLEALRKRLHRWQEKGLVNLSTRGFPRRTFASLPAVRTQSVSGENCVLNDLNDRTGASLSQDSQVIQDSADIQDTHPLSVRADADLEALLAQWTRPDDPFALEAWEADALRTLWQQAQARDFPRLELPHYDLLILQGRAAWREALAYLKGTPAVPLTLQLLDAGATAPAPIPTPDANGAGDCPDSGTVGRIAN